MENELHGPHSQEFTKKFTSGKSKWKIAVELDVMSKFIAVMDGETTLLTIQLGPKKLTFSEKQHIVTLLRDVVSDALYRQLDTMPKEENTTNSWDQPTVQTKIVPS